MLPRALHLAVCLLFTSPSMLVSAPSPDARFWMQLQRFITTAKQQPTLTSSSPFGRQLGREQEAADTKAKLVSDVTGTSKYTFEKTPWSVPINVNAKEGWAAAGVQMGTIAIGYEKVPGRNGYYYMPAGWDKQAMPVMVFLHGSGNTGRQMSSWFQPLADKFKFIIIAPESIYDMQWEMADANEPFTQDWKHVEACYQWVTNIPGVRINSNKIAYAGFSRGGYSAAALASRVGRATHCMEFHSSTTASMLGDRIPWLLLSTGDQDPLFPENRLIRAATSMRDLIPQFAGKVKIVSFPGSHGLSNPKELEAGIQWWYKMGSSGSEQRAIRHRRRHSRVHKRNHNHYNHKHKHKQH